MLVNSQGNTVQNLKGLFVGIVGPSGVGKGMIISRLKQEFPQFFYPLSHTTRVIRPGEKDGEVYNFLTVDQFKDEIKQENFLEWAIVHKQNYYGTLKKPIMEALVEGKIVIREIDMQGIMSIKKILEPKNLVAIFIKPENMDILRVRINRRGKLPEEEIERRMESAKKELEQIHECNYEVFSRENELEVCYAEIKGILMKESEKAGLNI